MTFQRTITVTVLILSTSLLLTCAAPASLTSKDDDVSGFNSTTTADVSMSEQPTTEPTTTTTTTTTTADKSPALITSDDVGKVTTRGSEPPKLPKNIREPTETFLLYEVEKGIHNLSLDKIEYVLDLDQDVFSYSLADKLGYLKDKDSDIHIPVIDKHNKTLISKLEAMRDELKSAENPAQPPTTSPPAAPPKITTSAVSSMKIKYDIARGIPKLSLDAINDLLGTYDNSTLPYAVGTQLGYEYRDTEHFQYLNELGGEKLREILTNHREKKLKEVPAPKPVSEPDSNRQDVSPEQEGEQTGMPADTDAEDEGGILAGPNGGDSDDATPDRGNKPEPNKQETGRPKSNKPESEPEKSELNESELNESKHKEPTQKESEDKELDFNPDGPGHDLTDNLDDDESFGTRTHLLVDNDAVNEGEEEEGDGASDEGGDTNDGEDDAEGDGANGGGEDASAQVPPQGKVDAKVEGKVSNIFTDDCSVVWLSVIMKYCTGVCVCVCTCVMLLCSGELAIETG